MIGCSTFEILRFCFMKGFSEVDDVMHNMVGCIVGYILVKGVWLMVYGCHKPTEEEGKR